MIELISIPLSAETDSDDDNEQGHKPLTTHQAKTIIAEPASKVVIVEDEPIARRSIPKPTNPSLPPTLPSSPPPRLKPTSNSLERKVTFDESSHSDSSIPTSSSLAQPVLHSTKGLQNKLKELQAEVYDEKLSSQSSSTTNSINNTKLPSKLLDFSIKETRYSDLTSIHVPIPVSVPRKVTKQVDSVWSSTMEKSKPSIYECYDPKDREPQVKVTSAAFQPPATSCPGFDLLDKTSELYYFRYLYLYRQ